MKKVLLVLLVAIVAFLAFAATRPARFHVERSITIAAPADAVYPHIVDFHQWPAWSPWEKLDPNMTRTLGGAESGVGATYHWTGNDKVGEGNMAITEARPGERVVIKLDFLKPFEASNISTFTLAPEGAGTRVTWAMDGNNNFMAKVMCIFMNMDKMVGGDFEKGLENLKALVESGAPASGAPADTVSAATTK